MWPESTFWSIFIENDYLQKKGCRGGVLTSQGVSKWPLSETPPARNPFETMGKWSESGQKTPLFHEKWHFFITFWRTHNSGKRVLPRGELKWPLFDQKWTTFEHPDVRNPFETMTKWSKPGQKVVVKKGQLCGPRGGWGPFVFCDQGGPGDGWEVPLCFATKGGSRGVAGRSLCVLRPRGHVVPGGHPGWLVTPGHPGYPPTPMSVFVRQASPLAVQIPEGWSP